MIVIKIDVKKIDKDSLYRGQKGTYLDCALIERPNEYGWDGFVSQSVSKENREAGKQGPIVGNWKHIETKKKAAPPKPAPKPAVADDDDIPW